jgi:2-haloacid dehalogenase
VKAEQTVCCRPAVVAFDVVGTLFSLEPLAIRLKEAAFSDTALAEWFSRFLHSAVALDAVDVFVPFRQVALATLEVMAAERGLTPAGPLAERILQGIAELPAHPDVRTAFLSLLDAGSASWR